MSRVSSTLPAGRRIALVTLGAALVLGTAGCGTADPGSASIPTQDVTVGVVKDGRAAALLPEQVRRAGVLKLARSVGSPPTAFTLPDNTTITGVDVDVANAVAKVLGIRFAATTQSFDAILPGLGSGKVDVGTGNFGVTTERLRSVDFVTYIDDGQAFATRKDSPLTKVSALTQLCGLTVGVGKGTTFEATLGKQAHLCPDEHKRPYQVRSFQENSELFLALQQHHLDAVMSTINGLRYRVAQQPDLKFLGEFHRLDVGFAFKKGSPLLRAFQSAVNDLIKTGVYQRLLTKWGVTGSAIARSRIDPPERG